MYRLTRAVMDEMQKPSDPGKLERISSAVKDGTYHIPTGELADVRLFSPKLNAAL